MKCIYKGIKRDGMSVERDQNMFVSKELVSIDTSIVKVLSHSRTTNVDPNMKVRREGNP